MQSSVITFASGIGERNERDMDLMRQILLEVESWNDLELKTVRIDGVEDINLNREVERLYDSGYLEGIVTSGSDQSQYKTNSRQRSLAERERLTQFNPQSGSVEQNQKRGGGRWWVHYGASC